MQGSFLWEYFFAYIPLDMKNPMTMILLNFFLVVSTFIFIYVFMPNTKVNITPAAIGGLVAGVGWFLTQYIYLKLQIGVARYNAIYGSLASLPLLLMWIYVGWVVFLTGAEVAYAAQSWRFRIHFTGRIRPFSNLAISFDILREVYSNFDNRGKSMILDVAEKLKLDASTVEEIMDAMTEAGLLIRIDEEGEEKFIPSTPSKKITVDEVAEVILGKSGSGTKGAKVVEEVLQAIKERFADKKISEI
jgi:membrane protein